MTHWGSIIALCLLVSCGTTAQRLGVIRQPILVPIKHEEREKYQGIRPYPFQHDGQTEIIPEGVVVDGASVPRLAWPFMSPDGLHRAGAYCHDWCYTNQGRLHNGTVLTRKQSDELFYDLMIAGGVSKFRASTAYNAVRVGGWKPWSQSTGKPLIFPVDPDQRLSARRSKPMLTRHLYAR